LYLSQLPGDGLCAATRRRFPRHEIQCRARICIEPRHYAGYLHNISRGGAKLRTITPIRKLGQVLLRLPDLQPLKCHLAWADSYNAGVSFDVQLTEAQLCEWARDRSVLSTAADLMPCEPEYAGIVS